jgi:hypothetical protein
VLERDMGCRIWYGFVRASIHGLLSVCVCGGGCKTADSQSKFKRRILHHVYVLHAITCYSCLRAVLLCRQRCGQALLSHRAFGIIAYLSVRVLKIYVFTLRNSNVLIVI